MKDEPDSDTGLFFERTCKGVFRGREIGSGGDEQICGAGGGGQDRIEGEEEECSRYT